MAFFLHDLSWSSCNSTISLLINIGFLHQIRLHTSFERSSSLDVKKSCGCQSTFYGTFEDLLLSPYTTMQLWSISSILEGRSQVLIHQVWQQICSVFNRRPKEWNTKKWPQKWNVLPNYRSLLVGKLKFLETKNSTVISQKLFSLSKRN